MVEGFDPSQPRDDNGKWVSNDIISSVLGNPKKIADLKAKVTDPEQRKLLDKKLDEASGGMKKSTPATKKPAAKLTQKERNAVEDYSTDKFRTINGELRSGGTLSKDTNNIVTSIDSALEKSPKYEGTTFRKFQADQSIIDQLQAGKVFSDPAFVSTSKDKPRFIPKGTVALQIVGKNGVDVSDISLHGAAEKEVLFPRGTKFKVVKAQQHDQGGWVAILQDLGTGEVNESLVESFYFPDFHHLPSGMSHLLECEYVELLDEAEGQEYRRILEEAWALYGEDSLLVEQMNGNG